ncbi:MAG: O-antigen ligase family protein [Coprothermobacterota bacterium]|nr:O-antigen ligase family protein [Coprothermobacterota bacterium]
MRPDSRLWGVLLPAMLVLFLLVYPFLLDPRVYAAALGAGSNTPISMLDFFYGPRAQFLLAFVCLFLILWSGRAWQLGSYSHRNQGMDGPMVALLIVWLLSAIWAGDSTAFWGEARRGEGFFTLFSYLALFLFAQDFLRKAVWRRRALLALLLGGALVSLYALLQAAGLEILPRDSIRMGWDRTFATIGNPIFLGSYLLLLLPLPLYFFPGRSRWGKALIFALVMLFFTAILLTSSRGAWLGLVVLVLVFLFGERNRHLRRLALGTMLALFLVLVLFASFAGTTFWDRFAAAFSDSTSNSMVQRLYTWRTAWPTIFQQPILGWGPDRFGDAFPQNTPEGEEVFGGLVYVDKAHMDVLQVAVTTGAAGLFLYLLFLGRFLQLALRRRKEDDLARYTLPGLLGYWVSLQLSFSTVSVAPFFWVIMGLTLARPNDWPDDHKETLT